MRTYFEIATMLVASGCYAYIHHRRWVKHLIVFAASHDVAERGRHERRWGFVAVLGLLPSYCALLGGMFLVARSTPHRRFFLLFYPLVWLFSLAPTIVFVFRYASPKLQALGYPGYQKRLKRVHG